MIMHFQNYGETSKIEESCLVLISKYKIFLSI